MDGELADAAGPEDVPQPDDPPQYGKNNRDLPQSLKNALSGLVKKLQQRDMYDRRIEVLTDRILRFYDDGVQHVYPNWGTGVFQVGVSGGYIDVGNGQSIECPEFMGAYNIFRSRRRSLDAVLTQNPPGIDFVADHPERSEDIEAAETAEGYRQLFNQQNDVKKIQQDIARMFELSGRCVSWTRTVASKARFGLNDAGEPRQMETAKIYGTLESKVPIVCKDFDHCLYVFLYDDIDFLLAKSENDWIKTEIAAGEAGLGESDWERFARIGVKQARKGYYLSGLALSYLTTEMNCFMRPGCFADPSCNEPFVEADETDEPGMKVRDKLEQLYPDGCHIKYIGKNYSESWNESPDDSIDIQFPVERDGMTGGALMEPMKVVQDAFNDYMNAKRENYEKGWAARLFRGNAEDYAAITDQHSQPGNWILLKETDPGLTMDQIVTTEPAMQSPPGFDEAIEELRGPISQDVTGALPALQGTSNKEVTATQQTMDRQQAMGMLGPAWANMQAMFAGILKKAALLASKNPDHAKEIAIIGADGGKTSIKLEKLKKGSFHAHTSEGSFPETIAAQRANLQTILPMIANSPIGAELMSVPDNVEHFLETFGDPDIILPSALAFKKQTRELEELLQQQPTIPTPQEIQAYNEQHAALSLQAEAQGMPMPPYQPPQPMPSVVPKKDDFHQWESMKCAVYLSSEDCWLRENLAQPQDGQDPGEALQLAQAGVENVRMHKAIHDQYLAQAAMAAQAMKPPTESINFKDESPAGQAAMNKQAGINAAPEANPGKDKPPGGPGAGTV